MIDMKSLHDELKDGLIVREYQIMMPVMHLKANYLINIGALAREEYMANYVFRARIDSLVAGILSIVSNHNGERTKFAYEDALKYAMTHNMKVDIPS